MSANADWTIKNLSTLGISARSINDSGQIAGSSASSSGIFPGHVVITGPDGVGITDLGTFGSFSSYAIDINNSGQVIGGNFNSKLFITGANGVGMTALPSASDALEMVPTVINDSGQVAGGVITAYDVRLPCPECEPIERAISYAYITGPDGIGITNLSGLGGNSSIAYGINNSGQAVGFSYLPDNINYHAFITGPNGTGVTDLGTLGGSTSIAMGINNLGQVTQGRRI